MINNKDKDVGNINSLPRYKLVENIKIEKGESRISFVGEKYTFKVSKLKLNAFQSVFEILKHSQKIGLSFDQIKQRLGNHFSKWFNDNLDNIKSNIQEYQLGKKYPKIVMNTKISIFGILNIQDTGKIISDEENYLLWKSIIELAQNHNLIIREGHTFYEGGNFARDEKGNIKLIDAGSRSMGDTLIREGDNIFKAIQQVLSN